MFLILPSYIYLPEKLKTQGDEIIDKEKLIFPSVYSVVYDVTEQMSSEYMKRVKKTVHLLTRNDDCSTAMVTLTRISQTFTTC